MSISDQSRPFVRVRGRSFIAFVLSPDVPLASWLADLDGQIRRSPTFFNARPVILDLAKVSSRDPGLRTLAVDLFTRGIRVIGTESGEAVGIDPERVGLPAPLAGGRVTGAADAPEPVTTGRATTPTNATAGPAAVVAKTQPTASEASFLLLDQPVRSGQSVVFPAGDITVLGSIGSGAEVIAGGSIHVYGALRGRAIAGLMGHPSARVFCRRLEAELLAIDGRYKTADDMPAKLRGKPVQAWLDGDTIMLAALD